MRPLLPRLGCAELARSLRFHTDVLGFALLDGGADEGWARLGRDRAELVLEQADADAPEYPRGRGVTIQVEVDDAEALYAAVLAYGGRVRQPFVPRGGGGRAAGFEVMDPDGYLFRFLDPPAAEDGNGAARGGPARGGAG